MQDLQSRTKQISCIHECSRGAKVKIVNKQLNIYQVKMSAAIRLKQNKDVLCYNFFVVILLDMCVCMRD